MTPMSLNENVGHLSSVSASIEEAARVSCSGVIFGLVWLVFGFVSIVGWLAGGAVDVLGNAGVVVPCGMQPIPQGVFIGGGLIGEGQAVTGAILAGVV